MTVLSLVELSTLAVRNGIEDGTLRIIRETLLPRQVRQCIFNAIAMHATFDNPNCIELIARPEFLDGFATFDTKSGKVSTEPISPIAELFRRMVPIFSTVKNDGEFFGSQITDLRVPIYYSRESQGVRGTTLPTIIRLVAECRKLRKLVLRLMEFDDNVQPSFNDEEQRSHDMLTNESSSNLMNISDSTLPWVPVLENLEKLAIFGEMMVIVLNSDAPIIPFKRLSTLRLSTCGFEGPAWLNFLRIVQPTLRKLHLVNTDPTRLDSPDDIGVFPLPMPVLEKLTIRGASNWVHNIFDVSVRNMSMCRRLAQVHLDMNEYAVSSLSDPQTIPRLTRIPNLDLAFHQRQDDFTVVFGTGPNQHRFISALASRIKKVKLVMRSDTWNQSNTIALSRMIDTCHNLSTFEFRDIYVENHFADDADPDDHEVQTARAECEHAKQHLNRLFGDKTRASKLDRLYIAGDFEESTLNSISENCTRLNDFSIAHCPPLSDDHLRTMARRGVVLSKLLIRECSNIRGEGLLHLVAKCGSMLEEFGWDADDQQQRESIEMAMMQSCKYLKREYKLEHVKQLAWTQGFRLGSDCPLDEIEEDF